MLVLKNYLKEKEEQLENINKKIKEQKNPEKQINLLDMKESLLEDKINIFNIMGSLNNEKSIEIEEINTKNKKISKKRRKDSYEEDESENIKEELNYKVKKGPKGEKNIII